MLRCRKDDRRTARTLRITRIKGGEAAIRYYAKLVRGQERDGAWEDNRRAGRGQLDDYYLPSGEEGGLWWGSGRHALGLNGAGTQEQLRALFDGRHPHTGEQLGQPPRATSIRAYDLTFSAPKTVSILASLMGGQDERAILEAHEQAVAAALSVLEERSTTRAGRGGAVRLDIGGLTVLMVRHRTSRALDPQLHTHALLIARVQGVDGRWRALDATLAFRAVRALGFLYQSALRSELQRRWPQLRWLSVQKGQAEIAGMAALKDAFCKRSEQVQAHYEHLLCEWRERHPERSPTEREEGLLRRRAARESRPAKDHAREPDELRAQWLCEARALGYDRARLRQEVLEPEHALGAQREPHAQEIGREAIKALVKERSIWSREDVEREVACRISHEENRSAGEQQRAIEAKAREAIETYCIDLAVSGERGARVAKLLEREPALERYSTAPLLAAEQELVRFFERCAAEGGQSASEARMARALAALKRERTGAPAPDPEQVRAAALIAGSTRAAVVVGPAGAGKTTMLRLAARAIEQEGKRVVALAPTAIAAQALRERTGLQSENIARWLTERQHPDGMRREPTLRRGDTLVVDEAGMVGTGQYRALCAAVQKDGARLVLIGDQRQLSAVGHGGMFSHAREALPAVQLERVHRFKEPWEASASLALRQGRRQALDTYLAHGRVRCGQAEQVHERMLEDWWEAHRSGESYAFSAPTVAQARHLSARAQARRLAAGELDGSRSFETEGGQRIYVGDTVVTRRNERRRELVRGGGVRNRETFSVSAIARDGTLTLQRQGSSRQVKVAPVYAREQVELAYFQTVHGVQGRTVQRGGTLVDELAGFRSLYVGMTRGVRENIAYVVAPGESPAEVLERALLRDRADVGVMAQARALEEVARRRAAAERRSLGRGRTRGREAPGLGIGL
jgi:conjugative relaxase-like TrwC/TraI family protein